MEIKVYQRNREWFYRELRDDKSQSKEMGGFPTRSAALADASEYFSFDQAAQGHRASPARTAA